MDDEASVTKTFATSTVLVAQLPVVWALIDHAPVPEKYAFVV